MIRHLLTTLFFLLTLAGARGQAAPTPADTALIHQYIRQVDSLERQGRYDSCIVYLRRAYDLAERLEQWQLAIEQAASLSYFYTALDRPGEVRRWARQAERIAAERFGGAGENAGLACNSLGAYYRENGELDSALIYFQRALELYAAARGRYNPEIIGVYQNISGCYKEQRAYAQALAVFEEGLQAERNLGDTIPYAFAFYYNGGAQIYEVLDRYDDAIRYYQKALRALASMPDHPERATSLYGLAKIYREKGYYEEALEQFTAVLEMDLRAFGEEHSYVIVDYQSLSRTYLLLNDYENARLYARKALTLGERLHGPDSYENANLMISLANALELLGRRGEAIDLVRRAIDLEEAALGSRHRLVGIHYGTLASLYGEAGELDEAIELQRRGLQVLQALPAPSPSHLSAAYAALGRMEAQRSDHRAALAYFEQELALLRQYLRADHPYVADNYRHQAEQYEALKRPAAALEKARAAVALLAPAAPPGSIPTADQLTRVNLRDAMSLYRALFTLSRLLQSPDAGLPALEQALQGYERGLQLQERLFQQLRTEDARLLSRAEARRFFEAAIGLCFELYGRSGASRYAERAWQFMEAGKAAVLRLALQEQRAMAFAGIPDSLLGRERQLQADVHFASRRLYEAEEDDPGGEAERGRNEERLFAAQRAYQQWKAQLERDYPDYFRLKYEQTPLGIAAVRERMLDGETALVAYFLGQERLYALAIRQDTMRLWQAPADTALTQRLSAFIARLRDHRLAQEAGNDPAIFQAFREEGAALYRTLLAPLGERLPPRLIVLPDGLLGLLPFELLPTGADGPAGVDYGALPYLLKQSAVRYGYSAQLLARPAAARKKGRRLLALAPGYGGPPAIAARAAYQPLPFAAAEAEAVSRLTGGALLAGPEATKARFLERAGDYHVLHLAMHATIDEQAPLFSSLAFAPAAADSSGEQLLYAHELYNLPLQADLVVLSACDTGSGRLAPGEGIMSLARAFRYAGSPNIVMSLWPVDDDATRHIMTHFYRLLDDGLGKAEALRRAKLLYLEQERKRMPHFWGAFVLLGDDAPVAFASKTSRWWLLLVVGGLLLGGWAVMNSQGRS